MALYAQVLNVAIPFFMVLIGIEYLCAWKKGVKAFRAFDTISSLSSGITNIWKDVLGLTIVILSYTWLYDHLALIQLPEGWVMYVMAFVGLDFAGYWSHRFEHRINLLWNRHIIHHSSEEFNLACALRQSISTVFALFFFLMIPTALLGVSPKVVTVVAPIHLFAQFWYHTRLIDKMGLLEYVIVTPSHHRVHHAINAEYLDRNFAQIFILWDKLFGTFQEELADVPPVYGVKRAVRTWNPMLINLQHFWLMLQDAFRTRSLVDKLKLWVMPTGWRPRDVAVAYPVDTIEAVYAQEKYDTSASAARVAWSWCQLVMTLVLTFYLFNTIADQSFAHMLLYGAIIIAGVFSYTSVMDGSKVALPAELIKVGLAVFAIVTIGDWFGLDDVMPWGTLLVCGYLVMSLVMTLYFLYVEQVVSGSALGRETG